MKCNVSTAEILRSTPMYAQIAIVNSKRSEHCWQSVTTLSSTTKPHTKNTQHKEHNYDNKGDNTVEYTLDRKHDNICSDLHCIGAQEGKTSGTSSQHRSNQTTQPGTDQTATVWGCVVMTNEDKLKLIAIAANTKVTAPATDGDYVKDEILYCGQCNTPRQIKLSLFGQEVTPYMECQCQREKSQANRQAFEKSMEQQKLQKLRSNGFTEEEQAGMKFALDNYADTKIMRVARKYVDVFDQMAQDGKGLLLHGDTGTGKTFAAACVVNELIERGHPCMMTNISRIVNTVRGIRGDRQTYIDRLARFDLLVVDDLGVESDVDFINEIALNVIDARYLARKPTIITTNLTPEDMTAPTDIRKKRLYSRLYEMCIPIKVTGEDRRKETLKKDIRKYRDILDIT